MSSVFGHGRLRLYLLKLLDEEPRHGYDIIRLLRDRFMGVYAPSAGTIYPRLSRLTEEGLVEHEVVEGKKVYRLTDAGRQELADRADELAALEQDIDRSVRDLAREVREDVRSSVRGLREELKAAARDVRDTDRASRRGETPGWDEAKDALREAQRAFQEGAHAWRQEWRTSRQWDRSRPGDAKKATGELLKTLEQLRAEVKVAAKRELDDDSVRELHAAVSAALAHVRQVLSR